MIQVLGLRRIITLLSLLALNCFLFAAVYLFFIPDNQKLERDLRKVTNEVNQKKAEVDRLQEEFLQIEQKKVYFTNLQKAGFFDTQSRAEASRLISSIQEFTNILNVRYEIKPAVRQVNRHLEEASYVVLSSDINLNIEALDDKDVYNFIHTMENSFPGYLELRSMSIERVSDIDDVTLRQIGTGAKTVMVKSALVFRWKTVMPRDAADNNAQGVTP